MFTSRHLLFISSLALIVPGASACAHTAFAQARYQPPVHRGSFAFDEGYERGFRAGAVDFRRGERFYFADESEYRRGEAGYRSGYGNREFYRREFRAGFTEGYRAGYRGSSPGRPGYGRGGAPVPPWVDNGRGPWGNRPGAGRNDPAFATGYSDGYEAGLDDGRDGRRNDPIAERRYRDGEHGYEREYGSRDAWKVGYRDGFRTGYQRGYQDGLRYR